MSNKVWHLRLFLFYTIGNITLILLTGSKMTPLPWALHFTSWMWCNVITIRSYLKNR
jgi:hypothetical protein